MSALSDPGTATLIEVLTSTGLLTAVSETVRWWFGRNGKKIDNAAVVQGMAIDLVKPLHEELDECRRQVRLLSADVEAVLGWAIIARALLDGNHVAYPPPPEPMVKRMSPKG